MHVEYDDVKKAMRAMEDGPQRCFTGSNEWCCDKPDGTGYGGSSVTIKSDRNSTSAIAQGCDSSANRRHLALHFFFEMFESQ